MINLPADRPVLFFDGVCDLCNKWVQFIIKQDKRKFFLFAPLQSPQGGEALRAVTDSNGMAPDSIILYYKGQYYIKSTAALRILNLLGGLWPMAMAGMAVPRFLRNIVYDLIARNRYKWFGKRDTCMIPTPELRSRFISE